MEFYLAPSGVQFELWWRNEDEFLQAKAFLIKLLGDENCLNVREPEKTPFYYVENNEKRDAIYDFQRELLKGWRPPDR
jgi:hypothetical protein